ncbi:NADP-dependent oxidoreductase [Photobacterium angustum]|uniref:NADP-dependent oxidoreductase n=1 Tax=Photobacterium angustum TaxID=661 RepID=A0A855SK29_PHOAN|nr:NADP-dependent oxidoreductase [Photobacterium angustum]KJF83630.1 NADP-dependent oxidoreductase [Photobacterium damselae subsp. damselae]KJG31662.1 NADP-dependent oxidoreductase [Photobacterium angustum]KJG42500.1 NADP-dependent oxidoreductase [Photobacterium angustum]KJG47938.1 NADP-dependent oxidoreductase [Photobacterium angustum]KJG49797.1 NADP-dependent oxidoreductase [Photobacterium angustum]
MTATNRQLLLASRPVGAPTPENFHLTETSIPTPQQGELLLKAVYLSLDPYMRGRMSDKKSYAEPVGINEVMVGGTVCQVTASHHPDYQVGEWVLAYSGWQDYAVSNGEGLIKLGMNPTHPSYALGVMGMPGFTAYMGLLDIGQPKQGDTIVVAAATGAVGSMVGQIGKIKGCRVVGIAGGDEKCQYAKETLGFDECIDHRAADFAQQLADACTDGIDIYYENVGGKVFDAVLPLLNTGARIPLCGLISQYNATSLPDGPDRMNMLMGQLLVKRIKMQGFIIFDDYAHRYDEFSQQMSQWLAEGKIHYREDRVEGLEQAPQAFIGLLEGKNFGKVVVKVS